ncbi:MAG: elongation factor G [Kiritimatiellia bacterium]|nr:elongation factor G [Lentisphaerota bacterium]
MKDIAVGDVRNFMLVGHSGSGKTSLCDALLFKLGMNDRLGSPASGTSLCDATEEEISRKATIYAKSFAAPYKRKDGADIQMVMLDTPGTVDFFGQVRCAGRAVDAALVTVDAAAGIQVGTRAAWRYCEELGLPRAVVVTGVDREGADFDRTLAEIQSVWGAACVPVVLPVDGKPVWVLDLPEDAAGGARGALIEKAAESDDALIEKFIGGESLTADEIARGLRGAVLAGSLIPVFVVLPLQQEGVGELLEGIARIFPAPTDRPVKDAAGELVAAGPEAPFSGFVWRTQTDPYAGKLAQVRVVSGVLREGMEVLNAARGVKESVGTFFTTCGKKQLPVLEARAGDVIAVPKLKNTHVNDTLCATGHKIELAPIAFSNPVMFSAVIAKEGEEDKVGVMVGRVIEDDPTLKVERNPQTHEMVISGMGDAHLELVRDLVKKRGNLGIDYKVPKVPYHETVTAKGEGHYKHKKQSGGRGQYAEVYAKVEPLGDETEWFVDAVVGGVIPRNFIPACEKGFAEAMHNGGLAGYPVVNVKVTVYDGSYHDVDSSEIAFKIAASRSFREAMNSAKPVLLEPVMNIKVMVPDQYMGDINGDLNHRRGRILGVEVQDGMQVITADVPQVELFRYCSELRSITGGRGSFEMEFARYDIVPSNIAQKVIAEVEKVKEEED